jgi:nitrate reductase NapE
MQPDLGQPTRVEDPRHRRRLELLVFFVLAIVVWPVVAVGVVGGWGFAVWMYQQAYGPPGPPHK